MLIKIRNQIPNILTFSRIVAIPFFLYFYVNDQFKIASFIFVSASITDALDGYLARRWNCSSSFGKFADPFADKALTWCASILYFLFINKLFIVPIILEAIMVICGTITLKKYKINDYPLSIGKVKTGLLFLVIGLFSLIPNFIVFYILIPIIIFLDIFNALNSVLILFKTKNKYVYKNVKNKKGLIPEFIRNLKNIPIEIKSIIRELIR